MSNCTDCTSTANCGSIMTSSCVLLSKDFNYSCDTPSTCFSSLDGLLRYNKDLICTIKDSIDLSGLDRTCYISTVDPTITVREVLQELINGVCSNISLIGGLANDLQNYFPNYELEKLNFPCVTAPCVTGPLSLFNTLQKIIDTLCATKGVIDDVNAQFTNLPYQYPIDYGDYPSIVNNLSKSDLDNLYFKVEEMSATYGSDPAIKNSFTYDPNGATTVAQTITNLWLTILGILNNSGGGGGTGYTFDNYFSLSGSQVSINCTNLKNNCITPNYIRSQHSAGNGISISSLGVISASQQAISSDTNILSIDPGTSEITARAKRVFFVESGVGTPPADTGASVVLKTVGDTVLTFPLPPVVVSGSTPTPIIVDMINAGVSQRYLPGIDYTINPGRLGITLTVAVIAGDIFDINYF